jgi:hypothetical protein
VGVGWVGGWGKADNKAKLSPAGAGSWAELGNMNGGTFDILIIMRIEYQHF